MSQAWRKCSICKKDIHFGAVYQQCSVSTCKKNAYCSVDCWEIHVPVLNHKSSFAEESRAPRSNGGGKRIVVSSASKKKENVGSYSKEILIVASKLKQYVKDKHDLNTSAGVMNKLSDIVRMSVDDAVDKARAEGRKTLMDRDF